MGNSDRPTVVIAGATGFLGTALREALRGQYRVVALTRSPIRARRNTGRREGEEWKHCDLFSPHEIEKRLQGADYAFYLAHSVHPSARLTQAEVADLDLLMADNFARSAAAQDVKQILYVGGLVPDDIPRETLPPRIRSRLEIQSTLGSTSVPLTTLRAGLIVGPGGTWLRLLLNLVRRLPAMLLPKWTEAQTQPIFVKDAIRGLITCLGEPQHYNKTYDVGGPDRMTYREMLQRTARALGLRPRPMATVPFDAPHLSKAWIRVFSGGPWSIVDPIVDSLRFQSVVSENPLQRYLEPGATPFEEAIQKSVTEDGRPLPNPRSALRTEDDAAIREDSVARSVQRLPLPPGYTARDVAHEYIRWLPRFGWPLLKCSVVGKRVCKFQLRPFGLTLLEMTYAPDQSPEGRHLFYVTGGMLADLTKGPEGRLEFRRAMNGEYIITAVHDFAPMLPWYVYNATQALAHLFVMNRFGHHLEQLSNTIPAEGRITDEIDPTEEGQPVWH
ncbi:nucleoside-diphosphate sugar epimerase [Longibacter salinarum]|uniref:Nucleoside-diphosphate sugar epimerase n=1 Tax=Longibacter salinarum TaxID=1850348 RepID=A0A2A8CXW1_9BACT|nr:NAD-dependent epimerase/dehydratase family protein [Longibacter salinarum]PEN13552.1 nucleoside-diphosphate sugar epimerase [Longibacter salinarum]